jgi:hypothetical protein
VPLAKGLEFVGPRIVSAGGWGRRGPQGSELLCMVGVDLAFGFGEMGYRREVREGR